MSAVGAVIATRAPHNSIGWLFQVAAGSLSLAIVAQEYALRAATHRPDLPAGPYVAALNPGLFPYSVAALATILLVFPQGRLLSRRWRVLAVDHLGRAAAGSLSDVLGPETFADFSEGIPIVNPLSVGLGGRMAYRVGRRFRSFARRIDRGARVGPAPLPPGGGGGTPAGAMAGVGGGVGARLDRGARRHGGDRRPRRRLHGERRGGGRDRSRSSPSGFRSPVRSRSSDTGCTTSTSSSRRPRCSRSSRSPSRSSTSRPWRSRRSASWARSRRWCCSSSRSTRSAGGRAGSPTASCTASGRRPSRCCASSPSASARPTRSTTSCRA